jgi:methylaspartate mutase epsilon subunit
MGPRGLSVLERLLVQVTEEPVNGLVRIWTFDPGEPGAGRIWRTTQPGWFMMNTPAGEVSVYSGGPDGGRTRAGAGPSLAEWLPSHPDPRWAALDANDYAPRAVYGEYLRSVYENIVANAPENVTVHSVNSRIDRIERYGAKRVLFGDRDGYTISVDKVVLTTGHPRNQPNDDEKQFLSFAERDPELRYLQGDSAADLPLAEIGAGEQVAIVGLGLTFLDVLLGLTEGRGGRFERDTAGELQYRPSGQEPRIVAGSRSGLVMLARGRNQKAPKYRYRPQFATELAITTARRRAQRSHGSAQLDFVADVLPLLRLEVEHIYYRTHVRKREGEQAAASFAARHVDLVRGGKPEAVTKLLSEFGVADVPPIDLERLARPFQGEEFDGPEAFHQRLVDLLRLDIAAAIEGNVDNPLKAALDILRDTRGSVRQAVEFAGLRAESQRDDFASWFNPINTMVSAGPPALRVAQACALIRSGTLTVAGPEIEIRCDEGENRFVLSSPRVAGSRRAVTTLIDGRIPSPRLDRDVEPLFGQLLSDGLVSEQVNLDPLSDAAFHSGSLAITRAPFHVIDNSGIADPHMYALGIPTENTRWFTQIGNGRPGPHTGFHSDADAIATDALIAVRIRQAAAPQITAAVEDSLPQLAEGVPA